MRVLDAFEAKPSYGPGVESGVVAVLDDFSYRDAETLVGMGVTIAIPSRDEIRATIADTRDHGATISLFFMGLTRQDVPIGSTIRLEG